PDLVRIAEQPAVGDDAVHVRQLAGEQRGLGRAGDGRQHLRHIRLPSGRGDRLEPRGVFEQPGGEPDRVDQYDGLHTDTLRGRTPPARAGVLHSPPPLRAGFARSHLMQTRRLGNSEMHITPIGFGAWAIGGGGWAFAWGSQDDNDSIATIREAIDLGINWIDTAAVYGLGHSEEVVAKALEGVAKRPFVFTKCARVWNENRQIGKSLKPASIRAECEASLKRLNGEVIALHTVAWAERGEGMEEGWKARVKLKEEGRVGGIGVSTFHPAQMPGGAKSGPLTSPQPPYSMIRPEVEASILPHCLANNI